MFTAEEIAKIEKVKNQRDVNRIDKNYRKCSVCGLYDKKGKIRYSKSINGTLYTDICESCEKEIRKSKTYRNINYDPSMVENFI